MRHAQPDQRLRQCDWRDIPDAGNVWTGGRVLHWDGVGVESDRPVAWEVPATNLGGDRRLFDPVLAVALLEVHVERDGARVTDVMLRAGRMHTLDAPMGVPGAEAMEPARDGRR